MDLPARRSPAPPGGVRALTADSSATLSWEGPCRSPCFRPILPSRRWCPGTVRCHTNLEAADPFQSSLALERIFTPRIRIWSWHDTQSLISAAEMAVVGCHNAQPSWSGAVPPLSLLAMIRTCWSPAEAGLHVRRPREGTRRQTPRLRGIRRLRWVGRSQRRSGMG